MRSKLLIIFLGLFILTAKAENSVVPINLQADNGDYDAARGIATYTGNVVIKQGEMQVRGDKVVVHISSGQVSIIEAWGHPASFHFVPKKNPAIDGKANYMKYTISNSTVHMSGNAFVKQLQNETRAASLTYDLKRERVQGNRVNMTLIPKSK